MIQTINGRHYQSLIDYGIRNLMRHCDEVNDLNVFPVPDGDTGTNMVKTLQNGFNAIRGSTEELPALTRKFAKAVVFGARGNSGVIVAQFFKGFSEGLIDVTEADCIHIASALSSGVNAAYRAVAHPVEGTILTVLRESSRHVAKNLEDGGISNVNELIARFLEQAKRSLDNTPDLLPILKSAGVVDSGGAGILYIFEGMNKYLNGEPLADATAEPSSDKAVDYTLFNRTSCFEYGYCTECLLQLTEGREPLVPE
ncbi:MAG: DAK2 domain-containing protein [Clostridia bacterium]|nr:DAK2 domain-containing protein [Clostridia bacterium]